MTRHEISPGGGWTELAPVLRSVLAGRGTLVVATSGSSGTPKRVELSGQALRASGTGTAEHLGGPGRWVLALPTHHIAGLQVLARSVQAGTEPVALPEGMQFRADSFARAVELAGSGDDGAGGAAGGSAGGTAAPLYTSLVPTQLHRLLADPAGRDALTAVDAVLLGGAAADPRLLTRARELTRVVTTYGMSETCGGCVYDGVPLAGVQVRVRPEDDRVELGGEVLAEGYVGQPELTAQRFVTDGDGRWFVTDDRGRLDEDHRLVVLGRVDDVINTGGLKVEPRDVEAALTDLPEVDEAVVVGLPDPEWGQVVAALLTPADPGAPAPATEQVRAALSPTLPPHAVPRQIGWSDRIPLLPSGKPDRATVRDLLSREDPTA